MKALMVILFFHQGCILKSTLETECLCYDEFLDFTCKAYIYLSGINHKHTELVWKKTPCADLASSIFSFVVPWQVQTIIKS